MAWCFALCQVTSVTLLPSCSFDLSQSQLTLQTELLESLVIVFWHLASPEPDFVLSSRAPVPLTHGWCSIGVG